MANITATQNGWTVYPKILAERVDTALDQLEAIVAALGDGTSLKFPLLYYPEEQVSGLLSLNSHVEADGDVTIPEGSVQGLHCVEISAVVDLTVSFSAGQKVVYSTEALAATSYPLEAGATLMFYWTNSGFWRIRG